MRRTGVTRPVDELGRIVIPKEMRRSYNLLEGDRVEFYTDEDKIIIKKVQNKCVFCGNVDKLVDYQDIKVCPSCVAAIRKLPSRR